VRYLPEHGWRPIVLTPGRAWAAPRDDRLLAEVPPDTQVIRTRSWEPRARACVAHRAGAAQRPTRPPMFSALRSHLAHLARFPDAHRGWAPFAVAAGLRAVRDRRPALIYSTAGPFTGHVVGLVLHRLTGLPWVAELRDGWYRWNRAIFPDYPAWRGAAERWLEAAMVGHAARVLLVTRLMADAFRDQYPAVPAARFDVVPNGFDPAHYPAAPPGALPAADRFEVVHAGALYRGRSLWPFFEAAAALAQQDAAFSEQLRLVLIGTQDESARAELRDAAGALGAGGALELRGYLDHDSTLRALRSAGLLLLLVNTTPGAAAAVPGKLFEYLAVGRPILAVAPRGAEAAAIVEEANAGWAAWADSPADVHAKLAAAWDAHRRRAWPAPRPDVVARYDRRALAGRLARIFDDVVREAHR
jgi:glycosyltransferase involved in cell wall biosynthesis